MSADSGTHLFQSQAPQYATGFHVGSVPLHTISWQTCQHFSAQWELPSMTATAISPRTMPRTRSPLFRLHI